MYGIPKWEYLLRSRKKYSLHEVELLENIKTDNANIAHE